MLDMMGHVSAVMLPRQSHIRAKAWREAVAAIEGRVPNGVAEESAEMNHSVPDGGRIEPLFFKYLGA